MTRIFGSSQSGGARWRIVFHRMSNCSHNVITLDRKAKRSKADPDAIMIESGVKASSSSTSNEDMDMANSEHGNEEEKESTAYEMLVKDSLLQQWSEDYDETLEEYLTIIGKAKEFPDAQAVNFRQEVICDAVLAAFQGNQEMISEAKIAMKTTSALTITSLNFLKHQQERLKIENERGLDYFLHTVCMEVLKEYYKRTKEQARLLTVLSESNNRMVPVNYLISKTELSHSYDVHKFVLQAERVAKWFDASNDSV
ncbi:unnamed protein product, partial [Cylindrotheca closterium]